LNFKKSRVQIIRLVRFQLDHFHIIFLSHEEALVGERPLSPSARLPYNIKPLNPRNSPAA
jgi:hypothetical protein